MYRDRRWSNVLLVGDLLFEERDEPLSIFRDSALGLELEIAAVVLQRRLWFLTKPIRPTEVVMELGNLDLPESLQRTADRVLPTAFPITTLA